MPDSIAFIPGAHTEENFPLGRFLPPIPQGVVSTWLQTHIPVGSWIIDPFCTSPSLTVEAAQAGYRILTAAHNPIERFLLELFCHPPTVDELRSALADLAAQPRGNERIEPYIRSLYHTLCPHCGTVIEARAFIWDRQSMQPIIRLLNCPNCKNQGDYPTTPADVENAKRHTANGLHWFRALERVAPINDPDRQHALDAMGVYLPRSVDALFTLVNRLDQFPNERRRLIAALLLPVFDQSNTLWAYPSTRSRPKQLIQPAKFREVNVWLTLEETVEAWARYLETQGQTAAGAPIWRFPDLPPDNGGGVMVFEGRLKDLAQDLLRNESDSLRQTLDLQAVIAAIPRPNQAYWSLAALWAGWLWGSEMTESFKSVLRRRRYDWSWHCTALTSAFTSLTSITQPGTPFLGLSGEGEPGLTTASLLAGAAAGFSLQGVAFRQDSRQIQIHWKHSQTPVPRPAWLLSEFLEMAASVGSRNRRHYLAERGEPASYAQLHTVMLSQIVKSPDFRLPQEMSPGELLSALQTTLAHTTLQDPALLHIGAGERSIESGRWFFQPEALENLQISPASMPIADKVEMEVVQILQEHPGWTTLQVDQAICVKYPGVWTPEAELIAACLSSYAEPQPDNPATWIFREQDNPSLRRADLLELDRVLDQSGRMAGYSIRRTPPLGIGSRPAILWEKTNSTPHFLFYITASAILNPLISQVDAYLNLHPHDHPQIRILVLPGGRSNLIQYKIEHNPILKSAIEARWRFLKFRSLRKLSQELSVSPVNLEQLLSQDPIEKTDPQIRLF